MEDDHDGGGRHQGRVLLGLASFEAHVGKRPVQADGVRREEVELVQLELLLHERLLPRRRPHGLAHLPGEAGVLRHGRPRHPLLQLLRRVVQFKALEVDVVVVGAVVPDASALVGAVVVGAALAVLRVAPAAPARARRAVAVVHDHRHVHHEPHERRHQHDLAGVDPQPRRPEHACGGRGRGGGGRLLLRNGRERGGGEVRAGGGGGRGEGEEKQRWGR